MDKESNHPQTMARSYTNPSKHHSDELCGFSEIHLYSERRLPKQRKLEYMLESMEKMDPPSTLLHDSCLLG